VLRGNINFTIDSMVRLVRAAGGEVHIQVGQRPQNKKASVYKKQGLKKAA